MDQMLLRAKAEPTKEQRKTNAREEGKDASRAGSEETRPEPSDPCCTSRAVQWVNGRERKQRYMATWDV